MYKEKAIAPVVLFVYNRLDKTQKTLNSLKANSLALETELFIFSDAAKNEKDINDVTKVRELIKKVEGFKLVTIKEQTKNKGLAASIIDGSTEVIEKYGKIIVLEDDHITSPDFLEYMNDALDFYKDDKKIWSITGYTPDIKMPTNYKYDIYVLGRAHCWSWATWVDRWQTVDWIICDYKKFCCNPIAVYHFCSFGDDLFFQLMSNMQNKSKTWYVRWCYSQIKQKRLCVYPVQSKVNNIGFDGSGEHCTLNDLNKFTIKILSVKKIEFVKSLKQNNTIKRRFSKLYSVRFFVVLKNKFKNL
jgi:hypothetical protein